MEEGETALDGTSYDGTVAPMRREMTNYDASSRFRMPIRHKNGTLYDGTAGRNTSILPSPRLAGFHFPRKRTPPRNRQDLAPPVALPQSFLSAATALRFLP
jgi:hypothetical protein